MDRYEELERLYYKKKYLQIFKIIFIIVLLILIAIVVYVKQINKTNQKTSNITKETNITKKQLKNKVLKVKYTKETNITNKIKKIKPEIKKLTLYPIFPDITNEEKNNSKKISSNSKPIKKEKKIITKIEKSKPKITSIPKIEIIVKEKTASLKDLINLYNISPNYEQAIKIAKIYFNKHDYNKSIEWSKKANKIEPEKSESWLLFAKNLVKLNKKQKAKNVLIAYLNTYGADKDIEKLLRSLK